LISFLCAWSTARGSVEGSMRSISNRSWAPGSDTHKARWLHWQDWGEVTCSMYSCSSWLRSGPQVPGQHCRVRSV